jgi:hypothetical protein
MAKGLGSVTEMVIQGMCFTPEFYVARPEQIEEIASFVRSRPALPLGAFLQQFEAVIAHDVAAQLARIKAPTQITFGLAAI